LGVEEEGVIHGDVGEGIRGATYIRTQKERQTPGLKKGPPARPPRHG
jgi:hypothetical protein